MADLYQSIDRLLGQLDQPTPEPVEPANAAFLGAMVALERRLRDVLPESSRAGQNDSLASLIDQAPISRGERGWLHELRAVRNALVHNTDVYVGKQFARATLERLREIAAVLDGGEATAGSLMTHVVRSVLPGDPIAKVQALMMEHGYAQVPVCERDGRFRGVITERSLLGLLNEARREDVAKLPATRAMAPEAAFALPPGADLDSLRDAFRDPIVQVVAVLRADRLAGILTRGDLIRFVV